MRKSLQLLIATALVLLIAAPVAVSASTIQTVTLSGTYSSVHEDALGTNAESDHHFLQVGSAQYELVFAGQAPEAQRRGAMGTRWAPHHGADYVVEYADKHSLSSPQGFLQCLSQTRQA